MSFINGCLNYEEIEKMLSNHDWRIRVEAVKSPYISLDQALMVLSKETDTLILSNLLINNIITSKELENFIYSPIWLLRCAVATNKNLSEKQIDVLMKDNDVSVRLAIIENEKITLEQCKKMINDDFIKIRRLALSKINGF
jgi:hypothetical protein